MRRFGTVLLVAGLAAVGLGVLGLLAPLMQRLGVAFTFAVAPWYGPFLGGALLLGVGLILRRRPRSVVGSNT